MRNPLPACASVLGALAVSVPVSVYSSSVWLGRRLRDAGFFVIPQESNPPPELERLHRYLRHAPAGPGFVDAIVDPVTNALACAGIARGRPTRVGDADRHDLVSHALVNGPDALNARQRSALLRDGIALAELHAQVWSSAGDSAWHALRVGRILVVPTPQYDTPTHETVTADDLHGSVALTVGGKAA